MADFSSKQLSEFNEQLLVRRTELLGDEKALRENRQEEGGSNVAPLSDDMGDRSAEAYSLDFAMSRIESVDEEVRLIDEALTRIEEGGFGVCPDCQADIPLARLTALPYAKRCIACQEKVEDEGL